MRKFRGIRLADLARDVGVSPATLGRVEKDNPKVDRDTYARVAAKLGLRFLHETGMVVPPPDLPPPSPPKRGLAGKRAILVSPDTYDGLATLAARKKQSVEMFLTEMVRIRLSKQVVTRLPPEPEPVSERQGGGAIHVPQSHT